MKRINNLTVRLLVVILPVTVAVLVLFAAQCRHMYRSLIEKEISEQLQLQVDNSAQQITGNINEINRMARYIYSNADLNAYLAKATLRPEQFERQEKFALFRNVISSMFSISNNQNRFFYTLFPISSEVFCDYDMVFPLDRFPEELPLKEMIEMGYSGIYYNVGMVKAGSQEPQPMLCMTQVIYRTYGGTVLGLLNANVYPALLENALDVILQQNEPYWYRCDLTDGQVIFENGEKQPDMLILSSPVMGGRGTLHFGVHPDIIAQQTHSQNRALMEYGFILVVCATLLILLLSSLVMARTQRVLKKFGQLRPGDPLTVEPLSGADEAARLDQTFTRLYRDYYDSVREQQKLLENQRLLENNLLLSRINPHFLYNTLSALRWKLPREHWGVIDRLVIFYRGMLAKGRQSGLLINEVELMRQYIALQRFTYSRSIEYEEEIAPDTENLLIPKFILQPVLENAVQHSSGEETLRLRLTARREEAQLILTIANDGEPISQEAMDRLNALNEQAGDPLLRFDFNHNDAHGYGIFNIIVRLRILFGPGYGLWYERPETGGTLARYTLPVCTQPGEIEQWAKRGKL